VRPDAACDLTPRATPRVTRPSCWTDGYGSYGICIDPGFGEALPNLPLVDRGVVYAIAHVRGGGEMGHHEWYEKQGKYLAKRNTFYDFVDCARALVAEGVAQPGRLTCEGRSAGGLLVGNVVNDAPELFRAALAGVPFVDLMVTMCDPTIPLTCEEWEEWGNPNEAKYHEYMMSYSPMQQVRPGVRYPAMLLCGGLNDPRVAYWEPTKWAQVLRERVANGEDVLLKIDMAAGHFSANDRYKKLRERAYEYAWLLEQLGKAE
jgi:oligopeptidase B